MLKDVSIDMGVGTWDSIDEIISSNFSIIIVKKKSQ